MCVLTSFTHFSETILNLRRNEPDIKKSPFVVVWSTQFSCQIFIQFEFFDRFSKNHAISDFMYIGPVAAELFHADRKTKEQ